jgi:hypothetical protein
MHRKRNLPARIWLVPLVGLLALAGFPPGAGAATPTPTPCATPPASASPCYTAAPAVVPSSEWTNPPEGRILTVPLSPPQTGSPGTWSGTAPIRYTYKWQDCDAATGLTCTDISGATSRTYTVASTDVGSKLQFVVTATNSAGTGYAVLQSQGAVVAAIPINRQAPTISGITQDGQALTASSGTWSGSTPITYSYQWRRCDGAGLNCGLAFPSPASSSPTYTLQDVDLGHILVALVTATNGAGSASTHSHTTTTVVTPGNTAVPKISGTAQAGQKLTESHGSWIPSSPASYSYQWQDCDASGATCTAIAGATSQTYTPTSADVGHTLRVLESATSAGTTSSPASSGATDVVKGGSSNGGSTGGSGGSNGGSNGGSGGSNGGSNGSVNLSSSRIRGLLLKVLAVHGKAGTIRGVLKHAGYSFKFAAPAPGRLVMAWYSAPKHGKKILVATVTLVFHNTGPATAKIVLTDAGRRVLSGTRRMKLTANGSFAPAGHRAVRASRQITLKA